MPKEERDQETRAEFYGTKSLAKYIKAHGVRSRDGWRDTAASSLCIKLDGEVIIKLVACLKHVTFFTHPQQINIMDKGNGKLIVSIPR